MEREILFRGVCKNSHKWFVSKGVVFNFPDEPYQPYLETHDDVYLGYFQVNHITIIPQTLGQYTGLTDSTKWSELTEEEMVSELYYCNSGSGWKGKKIFEGDIIKDRKGRVFEVKFKFGSFVADGKDFWTYIELSNFNYKVIGNIHQNPELIK